MATIFELVNDALATLSPAIPFGMEVFKQAGSTTLPAQYITYQLIDGVPEQHADNVEKSRTYRVQVNRMSTTGLVSLPNTDAAMLAAGFKKGPERQLPKDNNSGHYILATDYFYMQEP